MEGHRDGATVGGARARVAAVVPRPVTSWTLASLSALVIAATYWLALQPGAREAQTGFVKWINDPPQPLRAVLAADELAPAAGPAGRGRARPLRLDHGHGPRQRPMGGARAMVLGFALCEVITQVLKRLADQPRPTASIPGLDVHGYPKDPFGNAYPSAHTSVAVGLVAALWPWLTWPQRVVGVATAAARGAQPPVHRGALARRRRRRRGHRAALRLRVLAGGGEMADPPRIPTRGRASQRPSR